jgi:predicted SnoaL-like aldol condensation-catalyzing enzyme
MLPRTPEEWPALFEQHINAGNLDAAAELYDPDARFVSDDAIEGRDGIRRLLSGLIARNARMHATLVKATTAGDISVLYTDWTLTTPDGEERSGAVEVLRRTDKAS